MTNATTISWTNRTWNPVHGCSHESDGCRFCYAETQSLRYGFTKLPWTAPNAEANVQLKEHKLVEPLRLHEPSLIFTASMSDLWHPLVPDSYLERIYDVALEAAETIGHAFQMLTKREERMVSFLESHPRIADAVMRQPRLWHGMSIENEAMLRRRAPWLVRVPALVRFMSIEPLVGPIQRAELRSFLGAGCTRCQGSGSLPVYGDSDEDLTEEEAAARGLAFTGGRGCGSCDGGWVQQVHWVIVGGESGNAPLQAARWLVYRNGRGEFVPHDQSQRVVDNIHEACRETSTAFHFKQWGGPTNKSGGHELHGRVYEEWPEVRGAMPKGHIR